MKVDPNAASGNHPESGIAGTDEADRQLRGRRAGLFFGALGLPILGACAWILVNDYPQALAYSGTGLLMAGFGLLALKTYLRMRTQEAALRIAAIAFEAQQGMMVTDANGLLLRVNGAFTAITGYSASEAIGRTPRILRSGRHDRGFYVALWDTLLRTGSWQGEVWNRRKNGEIYPEWLAITMVKDPVGQVTHYVATLNDITERKLAEENIHQLAFYDSLTGLPNRRLLLDRLEHALATGSRSGQRGALLFIDLDNFKTLNDTLGHHHGDRLLEQVAARLSGSVREGDTVARLGGDEFVIMLEGLSEHATEAAAHARMVGEKIRATLDQPYVLECREHHSTASIGIAMFADHESAPDELMKRADLAMYASKARGRNTLRFFDPEMQDAVNIRAALEADLRVALQQNQFMLHYQPQVDAWARVTGAEALLRWSHPRRGLIPPSGFIPVAEETGLILPLGRWVLETACAQLATWAGHPATAGLNLSVNISIYQFRQADFVDQVLAVLERSGADPRRLVLELTESLLLEDFDASIARMAVLKARGVRFSLDDFGTGYSSLAYLKRLPLDQIKIDQSFVRDLLSDPNDLAIAHTIIVLARTLGLEVVAEGVENSEQHQWLAGHDCMLYQGFHFGRPAPVDAFDLAACGA